MMEAGYSRKVHYTAVLIKNVYQMALGILVWWLVGYAFALGDKVQGGFIGKWQFAGDAWQDTDRYLDAAKFGFYGMIVVFSVNIPLVERIQLPVQMLYTALIMGFIYPVVVNWAWNGGWLSTAVEDGVAYQDFGGCSVIHDLAGAFAIPAIFIAGRRHHYPKEADFTAASFPLATAGLYFFAIGQFMISMTGGSTLIYKGEALWNSWLSGGACCLVVTIFGTLLDKGFPWHHIASLQGFMAGVIAVSATAANTEGWDAFCIGWFTAIFVTIVLRLEHAFHVDDPANNIAWQFIPGFAGTILCGFFDQTKGVFHHGDGKFLGVQTVGAAVIMGWGLFFSLPIFLIPRVAGILRISKEVQEEGIIHAAVSWCGYSKHVKKPEEQAA